jgi:hypothetical protein
LVPLIFSLIAKSIEPSNWTKTKFIDPMCGGGAVALAAKAYGFETTASDVAARALIPAQALVANNRVKLHSRDLLSLFPPVEDSSESGPLPSWIPREQAEIVVHGLELTNDLHDPKRSLVRLLLLKAILRCMPMSMPSATDAEAFAMGNLDKVSPRRLSSYMHFGTVFTPAGLSHIAEEINASIIGGDGSAIHGDAVDVIKSTAADVVYLDPPYPGTVGYRDVYRKLDVLLGDEVGSSGAPTLLGLLAASAHIQLVVISYGGPSVRFEDVCELISQHRTIERALEVPYRHLGSVASVKKNKSNREYLIVATT